MYQNIIMQKTYLKLKSLIFCSLLLPMYLFAQDNNLNTTNEDTLSPVVAEQRNPSWLILEQGKRLYEQGNYNEALRKFLLVKNLHAYAPEANYLVARIFEADNNLPLAVTLLKEALDQKDFFYKPNDIYITHMTLANLHYRQQNYQQYEAIMLKMVAMELPDTDENLHKGRLIREMLQSQGIDTTLYYYDDIFSHIIPALNELSLYYYKQAYYDDTLRMGVYSIVSTMSQGIKYLQEQQYIIRAPQNIEELYHLDPEYIAAKLGADLQSIGIDYPFQWDLDTLLLQDPKKQVPQIIEKIREVDPLYTFSLLGYWLNMMEQYPATKILLNKNQLYRQLYFTSSALSIQGHTNSANNILNVLRYLPQAGQWKIRAQSQLRQAFIDKQIPLGIYQPN